jgi:hypothetical protein
MIPELSMAARFDLQRARNEIPKLSREQLEQQLSQTLELAMMRQAQVLGAVAEHIELTARIASLEPPKPDPLQRWLDMLVLMEKPPLEGGGDGCGSEADQAATASTAAAGSAPSSS